MNEINEDWNRVLDEATRLKVENPSEMADWYLTYHEHDRPDLRSVRAEYELWVLLNSLREKSNEMHRVAQSVTDIHGRMQSAQMRLGRSLRGSGSTPDTDDLSWAKELPAEKKVALLKAMGFSPMGADHQDDCIRYTHGSGFRCGCVPPSTSWSQPGDVDVFRRETWEDRKALAEKWSREGSHGREKEED